MDLGSNLGEYIEFYNHNLKIKSTELISFDKEYIGECLPLVTPQLTRYSEGCNAVENCRFHFHLLLVYVLG